MLHPNQFDVNEAWIAFRLNRAPVQTEEDGEFNCIALMDAASLFILGTELVPVSAAEPIQREYRRLLKNAQSHRAELPKSLFLPREEVVDALADEATLQGIDVVRVSENELLIFTREARQEFAKHFEENSC